MHIIYLKLVGYKRLMLRNIRVFTITPKEIVQLVLGTNGSGKTAIIEQLSGLPADPASFRKDGSKEIKYFKDGHTIVCKSWFSPSAKHSFVIDDVELNPGGTAKVQKELCKEHLGITEEIHELLRDAEKFTRMSPARRREWFTMLCDTDYSFAMDAYDKLNKRANHLTGAVKMNHKNLVEETAKIMSPEEEEKLEREVNELLRELSILNSERIPLDNTSNHYLDQRDRAMKTLSELSMRLLRNKVIAPVEYADGRMERDDWGHLKRASFNSVEEIDKEIDRLKHLATAKEAVMVTKNEEFRKQTRNFEILSQTGAEGVASLLKQIEELGQKRADTVRQMRIGLLFSNAVAAREAFFSIENDLVEQLRELPSNQDRRFGKNRLTTLQEELFKVGDQHAEVTKKMQQHQAQIDHADEHRGNNPQTCPKCSHQWTVGISEARYKLAQEAVKELAAQAEELIKERDRITADIKEVENYFAQYRNVMGFTKNVAILNPLWEHLASTQFVLDSPSEAVNLLRIFKHDIELSVDVELIDNKIAEVKKLHAAAEEVGDANMAEVKKRLEELTDELGTLTQEHSKLQRAVASYSDYRRQIKNGQDLAVEVERIYKLAHTHQYDHVEALRREAILHCISQVEQALGLKEESLRIAKMRKQVVEKLKEQVDAFRVQEEAAKMMVEALSPKTGLIAEGLLGFIRCFTGQMNSFIRKVWTYDLQIIPTGYDSEADEQTAELDYKFRFIVDDPENVVPDVSKGSDGQVEIIDLAFKMTAIQYLGLSDAPLFLDEPGRAMDERHRFGLAEAMKSIIENYNYSQLWLVSHYATFHGAFTHSETCVLDSSNIALHSGKVYNKHVEMII